MLVVSFNKRGSQQPHEIFGLKQRAQDKVVDVFLLEEFPFGVFLNIVESIDFLVYSVHEFGELLDFKVQFLQEDTRIIEVGLIYHFYHLLGHCSVERLQKSRLEMLFCDSDPR